MSFNFNSSSSCFSHCCKDCIKRHVGCHSTCEDYIEAKKKYEERKQWEKEHAAPDIRPIDFNKLGYGAKTKTKPKFRKK